LINQPPRSLKSICVSVAYVAWLLGHDPTRRVIVASYSGDFAASGSRACGSAGISGRIASAPAIGMMRSMIPAATTSAVSFGMKSGVQPCIGCGLKAG
jgi:hypothetical protein